MKKYLLIVAAIMLSAAAYSQDFSTKFSFSSITNVFVDQGVKGGVSFIYHSYQIQDTATEQKYGRNNKQEFGYAISMAVKVKGGYIVPKSLVSPWDYDKDFEQYREKYRPISYEVIERNTTDTIATNLYDGDFPAGSPEITSDHVFVKDSALYAADGFDTGYPKDGMEGWLVWFTTKKPVSLSEPDLSVMAVAIKSNIKYHQDSTEYEIPALSSSNVIVGGIYVVPELKSVGTLSFRLAGIMANRSGKWSVVMVPEKLESESQPQQEEEISVITEVKEEPAQVKEKPNKTKKK